MSFSISKNNDQLVIEFGEMVITIGDKKTEQPTVKKVLSPDWRRYLIGCQYNREKGTRGGKRLPKGHNDPLANRANALSAEYGEDPKSIIRHGKYAQNVDVILEKSGVDVRNTRLTFKQVVSLAKRSKEEIKRIVKLTKMRKTA